jgi:hypothetical protein
VKKIQLSKTTIAITIATATVGGLLAVRPAHAGYRGTYAVTINLTSHVASGSLGSARNSADALEYIGCAIYGYPGSISAQCAAYDANANYAYCTASDPALVEAARSVSGDSWLQFQWDQTTQECTGIVVRNQSSFEPKH